MATNDEKASKFVQAITLYAEQQRDKISQEIVAYKEERIREAKNEVLKNVDAVIQKETANIRTESVREMSRRDTEARREVLTRRKHIMEDVMLCARQKVEAFTKTRDYEHFLKRSLAAIISMLPEGDTVYYLMPEDASFKEALSALCPQGSRIELSKEIAVGGICGVNEQYGRIVDDTLDTRLKTQTDWFVETSGLILD